jgi:glycerol-3-phosphate O-acyltransferase
VPVLPVSVIAKIFIDANGAALTEQEIASKAAELHRRYQALGAHVYIPRDDVEYSIAVGVRMLSLRHLIVPSENGWRVAAQHEPVLRYYANAIAHLTEPPAWAA